MTTMKHPPAMPTIRKYFTANDEIAYVNNSPGLNINNPHTRLRKTIETITTKLLQII